MIRSLRAFAWLRWRLAVHALRGGRRRDALESLSRLMAFAVPVLFFALYCAFAALLGVLGAYGGWRLGAGSAGVNGVLVAPRAVLLLWMLCMLVLPSTGSPVAGHPRFLLLPVKRESLHLLEVLASACGPWVATLLPGLLFFAAGILLGGRAGPAAVALAAAAAMIAFLAALNAGLASLTAWILRGRRRSELVALVGVLVFCALAAAPMTLGDTLEVELRADGPWEDRMTELDGKLPALTRALPSELYGRSIGMALAGRGAAAWLGVAALLAEAAAVYAFSSWIHARLLATSATDRRRRSGDPLRAAARRLPGLSAAVSAVALAQARTALRSVNCRLAVLLPAPMVAVLGVVSQRVPAEVPGGSLFGTHGPALLAAGLVFALYAQLSLTMNQFASDRAGLALQMLAPLRDVELVRGKAVGSGLVLLAAVAPCLAVAWIVCPTGSPAAWASVLLGAAATFLWLSPFAAFLSAVLPSVSDLNKTGTKGSPHGLAMLLGMLGVVSLSSVSGLILAGIGDALERPGLALALVAAWTALAAALWKPLLGLAARVVADRRENLYLVARGR